MRLLQILAVLSLLGAIGPRFAPMVHAAESHDHSEHASEASSDQARHRYPEPSHKEHGHDEHGTDEKGHEAHSHDEHGTDEKGHEAHGHDKHGHGDEGGAIRLQPNVMREFGIEVQVARSGTIAQTVRLPGEVIYNADRIAHVRPTVAGIVQQVNVSVGDRVEGGETMAVLNSRELAAARSEFLAATARLELARENLERDRRLFAEKVGTERAALASKQAYREAEIAHSQAENTLRALGYSHQQVEKVGGLEETAFNTYEMLAPMTGIVTQRHITIGEVIGLEDNDVPFVVADLSSVWVNLTVYPRDLAQVRAGQPVTIEFGSDIADARGTIAFISPALDEITRTATARVVLDNPHGHWRPGLFVSGIIETGQATADVVVPRSAVTELDDRTVVFVQTEEGFEPREVRLGRATPQLAEIIAGLVEGEHYASDNVLALKAEMNRATLEHAGHVH